MNNVLSFLVLISIALSITGCGGTSSTNVEPTAEAGIDQTINQGEIASLDGSSSTDSDGTIDLYEWRDEGDNVVSATATYTTPNTLSVGTHQYTLRVTDNNGATATDTITVTVTNVVPVASAGADQNVTQGATITLDGSTSYDVGGGSITSYLWKEGSTELSTSTSFSKSFALGIHTITLIVTDNDGATASDTVIVTVTNSISEDIDQDYIPDTIENYLGMDSNNSDENGDGVVDGLDTQGTFGDTFFDKQWHIRSLGTYTNESNVATIFGNDLNLINVYHRYMGYNNGTPLIIQVVDDGVDADHEDLAANMDLTRSYNYEVVGDPSAHDNNDTHGTMVAGIMASRAFNGIGVRGIAPFAKIAGSNWLENQTYIGLDKVWYSGDGANEIVVSNNSWGSYFNNNTFYEELMELGVTDLRDGKGRIYVFAAGNSRGDYGNANLDYALSNRYAIAVAGVKHDNTIAEYSTPGANILVSGYSGNFYQDSPTIGTTTIMGTSSNSGDINTQTTWSEDIAQNYTFTMNGTSAASPTVAASITLLLEACPNLTWRDVRYLLATKAIKVDSDIGTWVENSAGLWHSTDYGFGLVNTEGMIDECLSPLYTNLPVEQFVSQTKEFNTTIPDDNTPVSFPITIDSSLSIEWVEVTVNMSSGWSSDYKIELTSPKNTTTTLMTEKTALDNTWMDGGYRFSTAAMLNEDSQGIWSVSVTDAWPDASGQVKEINIKIYGH